MENTLIINIIQLYCFIAVGFFIGFFLKNYRNKITKYCTWFLIDIATPIVIFLTLTTTNYNIESGLIIQIIIVEVSSVLVAMGTTYYYLMKKGEDKRKIGSFLFINGFPNALIYTMPIVFAFFNEELVLIPVIFSSAALFVRGTLGMYVGEKLGADVEVSWKTTIKHLVTFPPLLGIIIGSIILAFAIPMPVVAFTTIKSVMNPFYSNLGSVLIGIILSKLTRIDFKTYWKDIKLVAIWRFFVMFLFFLSIVFFLTFTTDQTEIRTILLIDVIGPPAVINVAFALYFKLDDKFAAVSVAAVTLLALAILPIILWFGFTFL
jgi:predicted permease